MQEKWNQFVFDLIESRTKNIEEDSYHALIENQLQLLGWAKYRKEILHKFNVPIGRSFIQPDILIQKDDDVQFVIEVKRPVYKQAKKDVNQLLSYIRQLKKKVGIYIGEHIEIFYDKPEEKDAVSIMTIPLELDNKRGARFVEMFSREKFNEKTIVEFCEECIEEKHRQDNLNRIKESLLSDTQALVIDALTSYLVEKYNNSFSQMEIQEMLYTIHFSASSEVVEKQSSKQSENIIQDSQGRNVKYSINGSEFYKKNQFVYQLIKEFVRLHPEKTFAELEQIFPTQLQGSCGTIRTLNYIRSKKYSGKRYFDEDDKILKSSDRIEFAVSTQWDKHNIPSFINTAQKLGFIITSSEGKYSQSENQPQSNNSKETALQNGIPCYIIRGGIDAKGLFNPISKSLSVLKGSRINISHSHSFRGHELQKRNMQITNYAEERNGSLFVKEDIVFKTPSAAACFCIGSSSNGWRDWKDNEGNELMKYRK